MFRTVTRAGGRSARPLIKAIVVGLAVVALAAPAASRAQSGPSLKFKENNKLESNGDAHIVYEIKLSEAVYTRLKKNTPNTAVFIRKLGLNNQNMVIDNVKGEWLDADSTLRIEFTALGMARAVRETTWEVPMFDGIDTELLAVSDGTAILTQAFQAPGLGLATNTIRIALPAGATDVKVLKSPSRLAYRLPPPAANAGEARGEFEAETKTWLMSSLAKAMSNRQFAALWTARSKFKNTSPGTITDYRVRFRIAEYAPTWSAWQGTPLVVPGQTVVDSYFPVFDMEKIGKLTGQTRVAMELQYQYRGKDGKLIEDSDTREMTLLSRNQVFYSTMKFEDCVDWADRDNLTPIVLASFVTHEDPVIQQAAGRIANWAGGANAAANDEEALKYMKAVYLFMSENIAYQTPPSGESGRQFIQHVKYGRDVLKNKAGTCIDLAILYGSLCQAVGLEAVLYSVPGHCFPAVKLPGSGKIVPVEATMIGHGSFVEANHSAVERQFKPIEAGEKPFTKVEIAQVQKLGAFPIDLPGVGEDPLDKWGIKMPATNPNEARPQQAPGPQQGGGTLVGVWKATFFVRDTKVTQVIEFTADGSYAGLNVVFGPRGPETTRDSGTYTLGKNTVTLQSQVTGRTLVRRFEARGTDFEVEMQEVGQTVLFQKVK
jgi:hypothetical protein